MALFGMWSLYSLMTGKFDPIVLNFDTVPLSPFNKVCLKKAFICVSRSFPSGNLSSM